MAILNEDEIYQSSTQYRLWAFTPAALTSMRATTNALAVKGVRAAIAAKQGVGDVEDMNVDCLTVDEEQKLVGFYYVKAMQLADFCEFPTNVKVRAASQSS